MPHKPNWTEVGIQAEIIELSQTLNCLPIHPRQERDEKFGTWQA